MMLKFNYFVVVSICLIWKASAACKPDPAACEGNESKCASTVIAVRLAAARACPVLCQTCTADDEFEDKAPPTETTVPVPAPPQTTRSATVPVAIAPTLASSPPTTLAATTAALQVTKFDFQITYYYPLLRYT